MSISRKWSHQVFKMVVGFQMLNDSSISRVIKSSSENASFNKMNQSKSFFLKKITIRLNLSTKNKNQNTYWIDFITELDNYIKRKYKQISSRKIFISNLDMEKNLITSSGSESYSLTPRSLLYIILTIDINNNPIELMDVFGGLGQLEDNFENVEPFYSKIDNLVEKLNQKSKGVYAKAGMHDVVLDADLAGILAHEAIGHTTEADLVLDSILK